MAENVVLYARISEDEQSTYSIPTQLEGCRNQAEKNGDSVIAEFSEDFTGTAYDRPELDKVFALAKEGKFKKLICYDMDRFARGVVKQLVLEESLKKLGVTIEYVLSHYDDTAEGRLQKTIRAAFAEFEREKIIERNVRGRLGRAKYGHMVVTGGNQRYGYKYIKKARDEQGEGRSVIEPSEVGVVQDIYRWYTIGDETGKKLGQRAIARKLTAMGVPTRFDLTPKRNKKLRKRGVWCASTISEILRSEMYVGVFYYNKTAWTKDEDNKRHHTARSRDKWERVERPELAIIDRETWQAAQDRLEHNKTHERKGSKYPYLMRSRLRCAKCGSILTVYTDSRSRRIHLRYQCLGQWAYHSADGKTIQCHRSLYAEVIDEAVWGYVREVLRHPDKILQAYHDEQNAKSEERAKLNERKTVVEDIIAENKANQQVLLTDFFGKTKLSRDLLESKAAEFENIIQRHEAERRTLQQQLERKTISDEMVADAMQWCELAKQGIDEFTFEDRLFTINLLNVTGLVERGETPDQDIIIVHGYLPTGRVEVAPLMSGAIKRFGYHAFPAACGAT